MMDHNIGLMLRKHCTLCPLDVNLNDIWYLVGHFVLYTIPFDVS